MDFKIVRKGYDTKEVDAYVKDLISRNEKEADKQRELILALKEKLIALSGRVKEYEAERDKVSKALEAAVEKSEEFEREAEERYLAEISQLQTFAVRWKKYYKELIAKYPVGEDIEKAARFTEKVNALFEETEEDEMAKLERFRAGQAELLTKAKQKSREEQETELMNLLSELE
jgi:hypothetical protein